MAKKKNTKKNNDVSQSANKIAEFLEADILLINSNLERDLDDQLIIKVAKYKKRKNVFLILITQGGDPDVAYRVARCLQDNYEKFIIFVSGYCKSAGTLCLLGANEIIINDMGELGPLDVQVAKEDEIGELSSGLVATGALDVLRKKAFQMFEDYMLTIKTKGGGQITFKTASEIAVKIVVGLMEPLYRQIDPMQAGEIARSMNIATAYGKRLMLRGNNFDGKTLILLRDTYPSHGFVIDKSEAKKLFINVRSPSSDENILIDSLEEVGYAPQKEPIMDFLSAQKKEKENEKDIQDNKEYKNK
jgi:hypothetical protein